MDRISLYGNIVVDTVQCVEALNIGVSNPGVHKYKTVGAIGNVARALAMLSLPAELEINSKLSNDLDGKFAQRWFRNFNKIFKTQVNVDNVLIEKGGQTSNAYIVSDLSKSERTCIINWGTCAEMNSFIPSNSAWSHFMYIDVLDSLTPKALKKFKKTVVSADLCMNEHSAGTRKRVLSLLPYIDFLILSDSEAKSLAKTRDRVSAAKKLGEKVKQWAIVHNPHGSHVSDGEEIRYIQAAYDDSGELNVLAAGDTFVASFVANMLNNRKEKTKYELFSLIGTAHNTTTDFLKDKKNEKEI